MIDLEENDEFTPEKHIMMEKDAEIKELKDKLSKSKFVISFLEQENEQLKVNQLLLGKQKKDAKRKEIIHIDDQEEHEIQVVRKRLRTKGIFKALHQQKEEFPSKEPVSLHDQIMEDFDNNREYWLGRINGHLEKLLKRENRGTKLSRHMAIHYHTKNQVAKIKIR